MLTVVCYFWRRPGGVYTPAHVDALARNVAKHYARPHRFLVVTNEPGPFAPGVEVVPDRAAFADLRSPEGMGMPSCFRRLELWAPDAAERFGERIVLLDLDWLAVDDVAPLWDRPEPVVLYRDPLRPRQANGSMVLLSTGAAPHVWSEFDPARSPKIARDAGFRGSDQAWLSWSLPDAPRWDTSDGVYSFRRHVPDGALPSDARAVVFHGRPKPWDRGPQQIGWVREHYGSA